MGSSERAAHVDELFAVAYEEIRAIARRQRRRWQGDDTLNTTALVHEAYVKLAASRPSAAPERSHLLALAATAMRHILCNHARARRTLRRGGALRPVALDEAHAAGTAFPEAGMHELLALDDALRRLESEQPRQARVVECRFFGGLTVEETASELGISPRTVKRDWQAAQEWLRQALAPAAVPDEPAPDYLDELAGRVLPNALLALSEGDLPALLADRYEVSNRIGQGGNGVVYRAYDRVLERPVALKLLPPDRAADPAAQARLHAEARAASALDHANVAAIYDVGMLAADGGPPGSQGIYIAMAHYDGETLRDLIAAGPLPLADALNYGAQLADALDHAHQAGIVHRDVKPANVLVTGRGVVKVLDFGVAGVAGTVPYMSPEQTLGRTVDRRSDIWSFGVVLYEMLTGSRPFHGGDAAATMAAIREASPVPVAFLRPDVSAAVAGLVAHCLAADPAARPAEARTIADELRRVRDAGRSVHPDARAQDAHIRARYEAWRFSREGLQRAARYIGHALDAIGENTLLHGTLGHVLAMQLEAGEAPGDEGLEQVAALADRVLAREPESARGHWLRGFVAFQQGDLERAIEACARSRSAAPDDPDTLLLLGYVLAHAGRTVEARAVLERAVWVDPLTPLAQCMPGFVAIMEGRFSDAVGPYRRQYEMDPESAFAAVTLGWAMAYAGQIEEAVPLLDAAANDFPGTPFADWGRSLARGITGQQEAAARAITPVFLAAGRRSEMFARALAQCYALAGENESALDWLEHAVNLGLRNHTFLARHDRFLDGLRGESRFREILRTLQPAPGG